MSGRKKHLYLYKDEYRDVNYIAKDMGMHVTSVRARIYYGVPLDIPKREQPKRIRIPNDKRVWLIPKISS